MRDFCATAACDFRAASVCDFGLTGAGCALLFVFCGRSTLALFVSFALRLSRGGLDRFASGRGLARCGLGRRFRWHK